MAREHPFLLAGEWQRSGRPLEGRSPSNGDVVGVTSVPTEQQVEKAIERAVSGFEQTRRLSSEERARILTRVRDGLAGRREDFIRTIVLEAGEPPKAPPAETDRALHNLEVAAEEAKRIGGEIMPLDLREHSRDRIGLLRRYPIGPIAAITPFNFPLNLPLHKLGPAIAAGNTAAVIIDEDADTELAVKRIAQGGYTYAGQSCISVQRVYVHESAYAAVSRGLGAAVPARRVGDPMDPETDVGPMIEEAAVQRTREWIEEAVAAGGGGGPGRGGGGRGLPPTRTPA